MPNRPSGHRCGPGAAGELTGPAFDPSGTRLYLSSQRNPGRTYEITGPFRTSGGGTTTTTAATTTTTAPASITLSAVGRTRGGKRYADLAWSGATAPQVEVRRDGVVVATTPNDGAHTDSLGRVSGTYRYTASRRHARVQRGDRHLLSGAEVAATPVRSSDEARWAR